MKRFFCLTLILCFFLTGCEKEAPEGGTVSFTALDGVTRLPVENARIVIPEAEKEAVTDRNGRTEKITVPVTENGYCALTENEGFFTVLAYCEGYNDYALFYARLEKNEERSMKLYLFKLDTPLSNGTHLATVESPDKARVSEIVDKYR